MGYFVLGYYSISFDHLYPQGSRENLFSRHKYSLKATYKLYLLSIEGIKEKIVSNSYYE